MKNRFELVEFYPYRKAQVSGIMLPRHSEQAMVWEDLVPKGKRDNHTVGVFQAEDEWGHNCTVCVWFHDFNVFIGDKVILTNE